MLLLIVLVSDVSYLLILTMKATTLSLNKVRGMLMGAFLGDALGVPHEFRCNANTPYTGKLEHKGFRISRFQGRREYPVASVSDDSEQSLALLRQLLQDGYYDRDNVTQSYLNWANSGNWAMGTNTRELLKGVKTLRGYNGRMAKVLALPVNERSQSNGSLMRCCPLALLNNPIDVNAVLLDVNITNPHPVNQEVGVIYVYALKQALTGKDAATIYVECKEQASSPEVKAIFDSVDNRLTRDITGKTKGWCLHAFWVAMVTLISFTDYAKAMEWIISFKGSDTDTNACIAGALLGAVLGFDKMTEDKMTKDNVALLLNCDTTRPDYYNPKDFYQLTEQIVARFGNR